MRNSELLGSNACALWNVRPLTTVPAGPTNVQFKLPLFVWESKCNRASERSEERRGGKERGSSLAPITVVHKVNGNVSSATGGTVKAQATLPVTESRRRSG